MNTDKIDKLEGHNRGNRGSNTPNVHSDVCVDKVLSSSREKARSFKSTETL